MSYKISVTQRFGKELKRLVKRLPAAKEQFAEFSKTLQANPLQGSPVGHNCFRLTLAIGGARKGTTKLCVYTHIIGEVVYLLTIYDKAEAEIISEKALLKPLEEIANE